MKRVFMLLLFICAFAKMNAQSVTFEDGKYYEVGFVNCLVGNKTAPTEIQLILPSYSNPKGLKYVDNDSKVVVFYNMPACMTYFSCKGWTLFNIGEHYFMIRREITKEEAEKLADKCIKDKKG